MPFYAVTLLASACVPTVGDARSRVVYAGSVADARAACKSSLAFDSDAAWDEATVTELAATQDLSGIEFRATITPDADNYARRFSAFGKSAIAAAACTITIAAPGVITKAAHGFALGDPVVFATSDTLPTGITAGTTYYANVIDADTFTISAKVGGTNITTSVAQAGAHTVRRVETVTVTGLLNQLAAVLNGSSLIDLGTDVAVSGLVLTIHADSKLGDRTILFGSYLNDAAVAGITGTVSGTGAEGSNRTITISGGDMGGSRLRFTAADGTNPVDVSVWLHSGESIDLAAARLVVLMAATTLLGANVTYNANVITIAGAANVGDKVMTATWTRDGSAIPELACTVNAAAAAGAARTVTLAADGVLPVPIRPVVLAAAKIV